MTASKCYRCWDRAPALGYNTCTRCCTHGRRFEKRIGDTLVCDTCGYVLATGLPAARPRTWQERDADAACDAWQRNREAAW